MALFSCNWHKIKNIESLCHRDDCQHIKSSAFQGLRPSRRSCLTKRSKSAPLLEVYYIYYYFCNELFALCNCIFFCNVVVAKKLHSSHFYWMFFSVCSISLRMQNKTLCRMPIHIFQKISNLKRRFIIWAKVTLMQKQSYWALNKLLYMLQFNNKYYTNDSTKMPSRTAKKNKKQINSKQWGQTAIFVLVLQQWQVKCLESLSKKEFPETTACVQTNAHLGFQFAIHWYSIVTGWFHAKNRQQ